MVRNGEGQSSHVCVFSVNFERHISTHITTSIECYLNSLVAYILPVNAHVEVNILNLNYIYSFIFLFF